MKCVSFHLLEENRILNGNFVKGVTAERSEATKLDDGSLILN